MTLADNPTKQQIIAHMNGREYSKLVLGIIATAAGLTAPNWASIDADKPWKASE